MFRAYYFYIFALFQQKFLVDNHKTINIRMQEITNQAQQLYENQDDFISFQNESTGAQESSEQLEYDFKTHRQQEMKLPPQPLHFQSLYQIYLTNCKKKMELKKEIKLKKQKKQEVNISQYDNRDNSLEQFIDSEEKSPFFLKAQQKFKKRQAQLSHLQVKYNEIKVMYIQAMAKERIKTCLYQYIRKSKELLTVSMGITGVAVLSKQIKRKKYKRDDKNLLKTQSKESDSIRETIKRLKVTKSPNEADLNQSRSENSEQKKQKKRQMGINFRFLIRFMKFSEINLKTHEFQAGTGPFVLPSHLLEENANISGLHIVQYESNKENRYDQFYTFNFILLYERFFQVLVMNSKEKSKEQAAVVLKSSQKICFDSQVIFCDSIERNSYLFMVIGTKDGILRRYAKQLNGQQHKPFQLKGIYSCFPGNTQGQLQSLKQIDILFALMDVNNVVFVWRGNKIFELNMQSFCIKLLTELPQKVLKIDRNVMLTENMCYFNYYQPGRISLASSNQQLKKAIGKNSYIGVKILEDKQNQAYQKIIDQQICQETMVVSKPKKEMKFRWAIASTSEGNGNISLNAWKYYIK